MQHVKVHEITVDRRCRLEQIILGQLPRHVRQRVIGKKPRRRAVDRRDLAAVAERSARPRKIRKRIVKCDAEAAKIAAALGRCRHGGKGVDRSLLRLMLKINEEIGVVRSVVNVRDLERPAEASAEALIVVRYFRELVARDRIRLRVKRRVVVAIVEAQPDPVDGLAEYSTSATSARTSASCSTAT